MNHYKSIMKKLYYYLNNGSNSIYKNRYRYFRNLLTVVSYFLIASITLVFIPNGSNALFPTSPQITNEPNENVHRPAYKTTDQIGEQPRAPAQGVNEYQQFLKSRDSRESLDNDRLARAERGELFRYDIDIQTGDHGSLTIRLSEYSTEIDSGQTNGGSSFLVTRILGERCWITDYSNGSYNGGCPAARIAGCFTLIITRQSVWYALYRQQRNPMRYTVTERMVCSKVIDHPDSYTSFQTVEPASWNSPDYNTTRITHHYGKPITLLSSEEICTELQLRYDHVSMVGASHIRYMFDYLLTSCFANSSAIEDLLDKHGSVSIGNMDFKSAKFASDFSVNVEEELQEFSLTKDSLMLAQFGAHDLFKGRYLEAMDSGQELFMTAVKKACQVGVKVIVLATPPFPDNDRIMSRRAMRNNYAMAAFNRKTLLNIEILKKQCTNVEFFDVFTALLPWQDFDDKECKDHYMCRKQGSQVTGNTGIQVFKLLITRITTKIN